MARLIPNTFQTFNEYVDTGLELFTSEEWKCLIFATRHILGWQDKIVRRVAKISISMFQRGFSVKDKETGEEKHFGGTGLTRGSIITALEGLTKYKCLVPVGSPTANGQRWRLNDSPDWAGLQERRNKRCTENRRRTLKARAAKVIGQSDRPAVSPTDQRSVRQTRVVSPTDGIKTK